MNDKIIIQKDFFIPKNNIVIDNFTKFVTSIGTAKVDKAVWNFAKNTLTISLIYNAR